MDRAHTVDDVTARERSTAHEPEQSAGELQRFLDQSHTTSTWEVGPAEPEAD